MARAGRFGTKGLAITFVSDETDAKVLNDVQDRFEVNITVSAGWLIIYRFVVAYDLALIWKQNLAPFPEIILIIFPVHASYAWMSMEIFKWAQKFIRSSKSVLNNGRCVSSIPMKRLKKIHLAVFLVGTSWRDWHQHLHRRSIIAENPTPFLRLNSSVFTVGPLDQTFSFIFVGFFSEFLTHFIVSYCIFSFLCSLEKLSYSRVFAFQFDAFLDSPPTSSTKISFVLNRRPWQFPI